MEVDIKEIAKTADFSGWVTKAGLKCKDGRTIATGAFQHQNLAQVPLVWAHGHNDPENVLGHVYLEHRDEGVYGYAFFNASDKAKHMKHAVDHKDIKMMSIWANELIQRASTVLHGVIREVSLVLSGANPGAYIENVSITHSDGGFVEVIDDEAIIYTGLELVHSLVEETVEEEKDPTGEDMTTNNTAQEVFETLNDDQKELVHGLVKALEGLSHADDAEDEEDDDTIADVYNSMSPKQKDVLHFLVGSAAEEAKSDTAAHSDTTTTEGTEMKHNVFENQGEKSEKYTLTHSDMGEILGAAPRLGSVKAAFEEFVVAHSIENIEILFPDAQNVSDTPEWIKRRTEWVSDLLSSTRKSPFSRIKTIQADITFEEARAKGYVTGNMKKEEAFPVMKRVTTPTTIYKKQALDRDDVVDITDFDVVAWLKGEMRLMLDEELARAILIGDGRDIANEDKINEQCIRPVSTDHEIYTTTVNVNVSDASSSMIEVVDAVIDNRYKYKGTGNPNLYTTEYWIGRFMKTRDNDNRRMWRNLEELAMELRVDRIIPVEAMMEDDTTIGIMFNPQDYVLGADKGGQVAMFDDFDIDYNKQKYLIETRVSGALVKAKSAIVLKSVPAAAALVVPEEPGFVPATGVITIPTVTGVTYKRGDTDATVPAGAMAALAAGASLNIYAVPASASYFFATSDDDSWTFTRDA